MTTVYFSLPEGSAEFEVEHFQPPGRYRWNEPPEPGELTLRSPGVWTDMDGNATTLSIEGLVRIYMAEYALSEQEAARMIEDEAYEDVLHQWETSYDDSRDPEDY